MSHECILNLCEKAKCPHYNINQKRKIEYIIVHYQGGLSSARGVANYFCSTDKDVSSHYIIDEKNLIQCVSVENVAWHCYTGDVKNPICRNSNSIGVDIIATKINKNSCSASDNDWYLTDECWERGAKLIAELCLRHKIPLDNVVRHYDVTGKLCPRQFCTEIINKKTGNTGNKDWELFKKDVQKYIKEYSER